MTAHWRPQIEIVKGRWRHCQMCGAEYWGPRTKFCSERCAKRRQRQRERGYSKDRREYYRAYYRAHREKHLAASKARHYAKQALIASGVLPKRVRRQSEAATRQAYVERNRAALKVVKYWGVSIHEARRMLESGPLPP